MTMENHQIQIRTMNNLEEVNLGFLDGSEKSKHLKSGTELLKGLSSSLTSQIRQI